MRYCNHCMTKLEDTEEKCPKCGQGKKENIPVHHLLPGTILENKFYVGEVIGEGGFGITYIGRDIKLDMKVAIKEFYPNGCVTRNNTSSLQVTNSITDERKDFFEKGKKRFLQEAQVLARFSDEPGIVGVRDFFEENNTAYIIMEYLDGITLKEYLKKQGVLSPEKTVELLMPVMMSLKKVHAQGMIHRDISPDNIMIVGDRVKLLDFGAARNVSAAENKSLSIMLKPGYAPEEQYRSKGNQGPWTDVYALCATMYKCITGVTPDDATQRVFNDEVKTPSALGVKIPRQIENAIMRGMGVQQKDRFQNIDELVKFLNNQTETVRTAPVINRPVMQPPIQPTPIVQRPVQPTPYVQPINMVQPQQAPEKKKTGLIVAVVIVAILAIVGVVVAILFSTGVFGNNSNSSSDESNSTKEKTTEPESTTIENLKNDLGYSEVTLDFSEFDDEYKYIKTVNKTVQVPVCTEFEPYELGNHNFENSLAEIQCLSNGNYEVYMSYVDNSADVYVYVMVWYSSADFTSDTMLAMQVTLEHNYDSSSALFERVCYDENMNIIYTICVDNDVCTYSGTSSGYYCIDDVYYDNNHNVISIEEFEEEVDRVLEETSKVING